MAVYSIPTSPFQIEDGSHKGIDVTNTGTENITLSTGDVLKPGAALTICPTGVITATATPLTWQVGGYAELTTAVDTAFDPVIIREDTHDNATYPARAGGTSNPVAPLYFLNVKDFGAVGDNATDDTAAIQAAINAADTAGGGMVIFPKGTYVSGPLTCKSNVTFRGVAYDLLYTGRGSRISLKAGSNASLFTVPWGTVNNSWEFLHLEGRMANQTGGPSWGIYYAYNPANTAPQTYQQAKIRSVSVKGFYSGGIYVGKWNEGVDVIDCFIANNGGHGIQIETSDCAVVGGNHILANAGDGIRLGNSSCTVADASSISGNLRGIAIVSGGSDTVEFTQGTFVGNHQISACHIDSNLQEGVFIQGLNNYVTGYIASNSQQTNATYANVRVDGKLSDTTTTSYGNRVGVTFGNLGTSNKPHYHILQSNFGASSNFVDISGSTFDLTGVTIDNVNDWRVYGVSGLGVHKVGHLVAQSFANAQSNNLYLPSVAAGSAAGTSPPAPTLTNGTDLKGQVFLGTGTSPGAGALLTVTFAKPYLVAPVVVLTPGNAATAGLAASIYVAPSTTGFSINTGSALTASQSAGTWQWFYTVIG